MDNLATKQTQIGKDIEKLSSSYRNDKPEKKTLTYLIEKLETFDDLWLKFENNHEEIRNFYSTESEHEYFKTNYYSKVKEGYNAIKADIANIMKCIDITKGAVRKLTASNTTETQNNSDTARYSASSNQRDELIRLVRRQKTNIAALENILTGMNLDLIQPKQYYQIKIDTIKQYWQQINQTNNEIWENVGESELLEYKADD